jgi:hypothetical protein
MDVLIVLLSVPEQSLGPSLHPLVVYSYQFAFLNIKVQIAEENN